MLDSMMDRSRTNERGAEKGTWGKTICRLEFMVLFVLWFNCCFQSFQFYTLQREIFSPSLSEMTESFLGSEFTIFLLKKLIASRLREIS